MYTIEIAEDNDVLPNDVININDIELQWTNQNYRNFSNIISNLKDKLKSLKLTNLNELNAENQINIFNIIATNCQKLEILDLSNNEFIIDHDVVKAFGEILKNNPNIKELILNDTNIEGEFVSVITKNLCKKTQTNICLRSNNLGFSDIANFGINNRKKNITVELDGWAEQGCYYASKNAIYLVAGTMAVAGYVGYKVFLESKDNSSGLSELSSLSKGLNADNSNILSLSNKITPSIANSMSTALDISESIAMVGDFRSHVGSLNPINNISSLGNTQIALKASQKLLRVI